MLCFTPAPDPLSSSASSLLEYYGLSMKDEHRIFAVFHKIQKSPNQQIVKLANELTPAILKKDEAYFQKAIDFVTSLYTLGDVHDWSSFFFTFVQFASLTEIELIQLLFFVIIERTKTLNLHYLEINTVYAFFRGSTETAGDPAGDATRGGRPYFPYERLYMPDFVEFMSLNRHFLTDFRELQQRVKRRTPSLEFWEKYDDRRRLGVSRSISLEFLLPKKSHTFLNLLGQLGEDQTFHGSADARVDVVIRRKQEELKNSADVRRAIKNTFGVRDASILEPPLTDYSSVPAWMKEFVFLSQPRSAAQRASEIEFLIRRRKQGVEPSLVAEMDKKWN